ncbi:hypothetical protein HYV86_01000 [Candidatus Woesearchaeota archaeon]|nr:hypothetical protein [Candidatus Woesearchaeota archaeon]
MIPSTHATPLIEAIIQKKELRGLDQAFVLNTVEEYFRKNPAFLKEFVSKPFNEKSSVTKIIIKDVRASLRRVYGLFRTQGNVTKEDVERYFASKYGKKALVELLSLHHSTKERLEFYQQLYQDVFRITGDPRSIIDLGCGLNPLSLPLMGLSDVRYYAYDVSKQEIAVLDYFFSRIAKLYPEINARAQILDISNVEGVRHLPKSDVCFMFKVTDHLDKGKGHKMTEEVLKAVPTRFIVLSFATKTMSGKEMTAPRRGWVEYLCNRLGYTFDVLKYDGEIVYVVVKNK